MAHRSNPPVTVDEYERMIEAGLLTKDDHVELIEGDIVEMEPIGAAHAGCVDALTNLFRFRAPAEVLLQVQGPVLLLPQSMPQPDVALIRARPHGYRRERPRPADIILLIEVCDSSFQRDLRDKVPLYARAGVPEVWLVHLAGQRLLRFLEPSGSEWRRTDVLTRGASLAPVECPGALLTIDEILGEPNPLPDDEPE